MGICKGHISKWIFGSALCLLGSALLASLFPAWKVGAANIHASDAIAARAADIDPKIRRSHEFAWNLFRAFLYGGKGDPDWGNWNAWKTKAELCLGTRDSCKLARGEEARSLSDLVQGHLDYPIQAANVLSDREDLKDTDKPGKMPYATVLYNRIAANYIAAGIDRSIMNRLLSNRAQDIPPFPDGSIVIKTFWELLQNSANEAENQSLNVWDPLQRPPARNKEGGFGVPTGWTDSIVHVDTAKTSDCPLTDFALVSASPAGLASPVSNGTVPLGCFYYLKVTNKNRQSVESGVVPSQHPKDGDFIVLLGVHIVKKVNARWVWSTFWWTTRPSYSIAGYPSYGDRPRSLDRRWSHYAMNTTVDVLDAGNERRVIFNPYIEGSGANPTVSNCILCHGRAAFNARMGIGEALGSPDINGQLPSRVNSGQDESYFNHTVRTDYLWSIVAPSR